MRNLRRVEKCTPSLFHKCSWVDVASLGQRFMALIIFIIVCFFRVSRSLVYMPTEYHPNVICWRMKFIFREMPHRVLIRWNSKNCNLCMPPDECKKSLTPFLIGYVLVFFIADYQILLLQTYSLSILVDDLSEYFIFTCHFKLPIPCYTYLNVEPFGLKHF